MASFRVFALLALNLLSVGWTNAKPAPSAPVTIQNDDPLIYFHGRWDASPGTWWAGSGFKLNVQGLTSLTLNLGEHTTTPYAPVGVSIDYAPFVDVNVTAGSNVIPLGDSLAEKSKNGNTVVRLNVQGFYNNRIHLENMVLNPGAKLLHYTPSKLSLHFIGDSLSVGYGHDADANFLPHGINRAWTFLTSEFFKAEHVIVAQPGAALSDIFSYGNAHGMSYQFFQTEDTGYYYTADHNFTTAWDFKRDIPKADAVVIHLGANDSSQGVSAADFLKNFLSFLTDLRKIYRSQPILILSPWGWPNSNGNIYQYYQGTHQQVVDARRALGDLNTFLVDATGWITYEDVLTDNQHLSLGGHARVADLFEAWLQDFGIKPQRSWSTSVRS